MELFFKALAIGIIGYIIVNVLSFIIIAGYVMWTVRQSKKPRREN